MSRARQSSLPIVFCCLIWLSGFPFEGTAQTVNSDTVMVYEGTVDLPSYEFQGREMQPTLFENSSLQGHYPLPPFLHPYKPGGPKPASYQALFVENQYLKMTVVPDFGGRIYSLYDKVNKREVFYKNDVLKFSGVNDKNSWPVGNIELTGPHDMHMLTLYGEPLWFDKVRRNQDGSVSVVLGNIDPYYRMKVNFIASIIPGLAAMKINVFCYNPRDSRQPFMFWVNAGVHVGDSTRFVYPMTRTIGHTTAEVADWPYYGGVDYSWIRNNQHMLGVFGIDIYDNYLGAYDYGLDYGTFRFADRRVAQGMKTWTWGGGYRSGSIERGYTDNAGSYIEVQSGRYVWDGHYEWLDPHRYEGWSEWWFPVAGIGGLVTTSRDVALNLEVSPDPRGKNSRVKVALSANRKLDRATVSVRALKGPLFKEIVDLAPGKPFSRNLSKIAADSAGLSQMTVTVITASGEEVLRYLRPDSNPGRKEYTTFTMPIESPQKKLEEMSVEELVLDAETKIKEMHVPRALSQLRLALDKDPGHSRAHLNLGILYYDQGKIDSALVHLEKVVERDPYADQGYYYLSLCHLERGDTLKAGRSLYFIPRTSAYYNLREYLLGRMAFMKGDLASAEEHLAEAVLSNGYNLSGRNLLALVYRIQGRKDKALALVASVQELDPTNRWAQAEKSLVTGDAGDFRELLRLLGGQSQEAIELSICYRNLCRWDEALRVLSLVEQDNHDPYGTPPIFYYTVAQCLKHAGRENEASGYYEKARRAEGNLDRFPFRPESVAPLAEALIYNPGDVTARFSLACLLYYLGRPGEAIHQWEEAVEADPGNFSSRRALGLAYEEQGYGAIKAGEQLEVAISLDPTNVRTFNDLSTLYAKEGKFENQLALLRQALKRSPNDDLLVEGIFTAALAMGDYNQADSIIKAHQFAQRHRSYGLRDNYRIMRYGIGAKAFQRKDYQEALRQFEMALYPPTTLGADDFQFQSAPRLYYYIGRAQEMLGQKDQARQSFEKSASGWEYLSGDRDSWNTDNFYMALSLEKIGKEKEAAGLLKSMDNFSVSQMESRQSRWRSAARYLNALVEKKKGNYTAAASLLNEALQIEPSMLGPRFELRGDVLDPLPGLGQIKAQ